MMAYEGSKSGRDNFGKFIYQFQPETKTLIRKLERILNYRDKICLYYLMKHTHTHTHTHIYIYIYILKKKKKNTPYTSKQPLRMAYEGSESDWDNFGKFIYQFQLETKTLIRKLERILDKLYRQNFLYYLMKHA